MSCCKAVASNFDLLSRNYGLLHCTLASCFGQLSFAGVYYYILNYTLHTIYFTFYILYIIHYNYILHMTSCFGQLGFAGVNYIPYTICYILHTIYYKLYTIYYIWPLFVGNLALQVYTIYHTLYTLFYMLYTIHIYYIVCTTYYTLCRIELKLKPESQVAFLACSRTIEGVSSVVTGVAFAACGALPV